MRCWAREKPLFSARSTPAGARCLTGTPTLWDHPGSLTANQVPPTRSMVSVCNSSGRGGPSQVALPGRQLAWVQARDPWRVVLPPLSTVTALCSCTHCASMNLEQGSSRGRTGSVGTPGNLLGTSVPGPPRAFGWYGCPAHSVLSEA